MEFEWDPGNILHIAQHGVEAEEAEAAVQDLRAPTSEWYMRNHEWRLDIIGRSGRRTLVVIITTRDPRVRVVSARDANRIERQRYPRLQQ